QTRFLHGVLCRAEIQVNLTAGGDPRPVAAEIVSGSYFAVLGVGLALGRVIEPEDDAAPGAGPVVVLSYDFWQAQFGGAADIVGRKVLIGNHPMTVVGVAAAGFRGVDVGAVPAFRIPTSMYADANLGTDEDLFNGPERWLQILARLRPGVSAAQAQAGLVPWFRPWLEDSARRPGFPVITAEKRRRYLASSLILTPAPQGHSPLRRSLSQPLWLLFAATGVLLGLACLNVAGLFLARGSARGREIGTRLALGASRGRIGRQLLADSLLPHPPPRRRPVPAYAHRPARQRPRLRYFEPPHLRHRSAAERLFPRRRLAARPPPRRAGPRFARRALFRRCPICLPHRRRL